MMKMKNVPLGYLLRARPYTIPTYTSTRLHISSAPTYISPLLHIPTYISSPLQQQHKTLIKYTSPTLLSSISPIHHRYSHNGSDEVRWLFKANNHIQSFAGAAIHGIFNYVNCWTINSAQPIPTSAFQQLAHHLNRKVQSLRTCLRYKDGELWVCEVTHPKVDFKVCDGDVEDEMTKLNNQVFNQYEGPLWRFRLFICQDSEPCPIPHLKSAFPYQYIMCLNFHHGINDGLSAFVIFMLSLKLLKDVIKHVPIDDSQIYKLIDPFPFIKYEQNIRHELEKDPENLSRFLREIDVQNFCPLINQAFGDKYVNHPISKSHSVVIDHSVAEAFAKKCRAIGITVSNGFKCTTDRALVELVREAGLVKDFYSIKSRQTINERPYIDSNPMTDAGCFAAFITHTMNLDYPEIQQEFWKYAKRYDTQFREKLQQKYSFIERIVRSKLLPPNFSYETFFATQPQLSWDYNYTNLVIPHFKTLGKGDDLLQVTDYRCLFRMKNTSASAFITVEKYGGRYSYSIHYSTATVSEDVAKRFLKVALRCLSNLAQ